MWIITLETTRTMGWKEHQIIWEQLYKNNLMYIFNFVETKKENVSATIGQRNILKAGDY
jgi:hypothetical protein